jgi:NAD(P)-dependent dehydrogenase (short-subunit alcohol dehydrogenase family)
LPGDEITARSGDKATLRTFTSDRLRLDGLNALIVGTGPAIGQAIARAVAGAGARTTLVARNAGAVEALATAIREAGGTARAFARDISDPIARTELVQATGPVDVLIYNAYAIDAGGVSTWDLASPLDASEDDWNACFQTNLLAPFALAKALVPGMIERGRGNVIHCLAAAAYTPILPAMAYGATKAGLATMTAYLAKACAPAVRVNAIAPSNIEVPGRPEALRAAALQLPMRRMGLPEEVADAALFLASDASSFITGQVIHVDGGRIATA